MKTNSLFKRLVSMLIVVLMICTLFPVTALADDPPAQPNFDDFKRLLKVEIDCETKEHEHEDITYSGDKLIEDSFSVGEVNGEFCTVIVSSEKYIDAFDDTYKIEHSPEVDDDENNEEATVRLVYADGAWKLDKKYKVDQYGRYKIEFDVVCNGTPTPPEKPTTKYLEEGLLANGAVKIDCINAYAGHGDRTYGLLAGSYNVSEPTLSGDKYTCTVTVDSAEYIKQYNTDIGTAHSLAAGETATTNITLEHNGTGWVVVSTVPVVFTVDCNTPAPAVTGIEKEVVKDPTGLTNVPTGITYPNANNIATVPYGTTSVTLLYRVTVSGDAGASYSVTDTDATCISNNASGTIPEGGNAVLYFTKTFTGLTTGDNTCSNTAAVGNTNSNTVDVTVKVSIPEKPTEKYLEEELLANGAVKIDCTNTKVNHADKTYGLLKGSYDIGEPQKVERTDVYTCEITVYAAPYVAQYSTDMNKGHSLADVGSKKVILVYNGDEWIVPPVELAAGDDFEYESAFPVTFNVVCEETPATTYTVTYKDGVGGKVFKDDVHTVESGATTPAFVGGIPTRPGYVFVGWTPAVSKTVTGDATYTATWRKVKDTTVIEIGGGNSSSSSSKEENPNTGAPVFVGVSVGALAAAK